MKYQVPQRDSKPDIFMQFYGNDFFQAVEGMPDAVALKYLRLIWYYWQHNHCRGLINDDEFLRRIARAEREEWSGVKVLLFDNDNFFTIETGLWHQKRCRDEYNRALDSINKNKQRTAAATYARWLNKRKQ